MQFPEAYESLSLEEQYRVLSYWAEEYPEAETVNDEEFESLIDEAL